MRSRGLDVALTVFVEEAAVAFQELLAGGAEVPLEIIAQSSRRGQAPLYSYRPLTWRFVRERAEKLERLPTHGQALAELTDFGGLERYLRMRGLDEIPLDPGGQARRALELLLEHVFAEQTDFKLRRQRLRSELELLDGTARTRGPSGVTIIATLHGVALGMPELTLAPGLSLAQPSSMHGLPEDLVGEEGGSGEQLLIVYTGEGQNGSSTIAEGRVLLRELLRALRLFGDGRVCLGAIGWARGQGGRWRAIALGSGGRPRGRLLITPDQEDQLRTFCALVSRRTPTGNALAWALERFEMACERVAPIQALSDYLLALRALFHCFDEGAPGFASEELLARRMAAVCDPSVDGEDASARTLEAFALERSIVAHGGLRDVRQEAIIRTLGEQVRTLLRDVICGRLDSNLASLAEARLKSRDSPPNRESEPLPRRDLAPEASPSGISGSRTVRKRARSDEEQTVVISRAPRKVGAAGSR